MKLKNYQFKKLIQDLKDESNWFIHTEYRIRFKNKGIDIVYYRTVFEVLFMTHIEVKLIHENYKLTLIQRIITKYIIYKILKKKKEELNKELENKLNKVLEI